MSLSSMVFGEVLSFLGRGVSLGSTGGAEVGKGVYVPAGLLGFDGEGEFDLLFLWTVMSDDEEKGRGWIAYQDP